MSEYRLEMFITRQIEKHRDEPATKVAHEIVEDLKLRIRSEWELLQALSRP